MKIAIIGCGNMGKALGGHLAKKQEVVVCDRDVKLGQSVAKKIGAAFMESASQAVLGAKWVILAIKPKDLSELSSSLSLHPGQKMISLLAGTDLSSLKKVFPKVQIIRLMPNLAVIVHASVLGFCDDGHLSEEEKEEIHGMFKGLGLLLWLSENRMDALTSLGASSLAFVMVMMEAMIEAGIEIGFSAKEAQEIVLKVFEGASSLVRYAEDHPAEMKWKIASPGGTTIAGLKALEASGVKNGIWNAVLASYQRSRAMTKEHEF